MRELDWYELRDHTVSTLSIANFMTPVMVCAWAVADGYIELASDQHPRDGAAIFGVTFRDLDDRDPEGLSKAFGTRELAQQYIHEQWG